MRRLAEFLRSVIPEDPFQLLFLSGVVCLTVAHGLVAARGTSSPCGAIFRRVWAVAAIRRGVFCIFHNLFGNSGLFCLFLARQTSGTASYPVGVRSRVVRAEPDVHPYFLP